VCNSEDLPFAVFVTLYDHGAERVDFYGRSCAKHATGVVGEMLFGRVEAV
jgi:hypothetical protein